MGDKERVLWTGPVQTGGDEEEGHGVREGRAETYFWGGEDTFCWGETEGGVQSDAQVLDCGGEQLFTRAAPWEPQANQ